MNRSRKLIRSSGSLLNVANDVLWTLFLKAGYFPYTGDKTKCIKEEQLQKDR